MQSLAEQLPILDITQTQHIVLTSRPNFLGLLTFFDYAHVHPSGRRLAEHGTGLGYFFNIMTPVQVRHAVRLQKAAERKEKLTYRGVQYLLVK